MKLNEENKRLYEIQKDQQKIAQLKNIEIDNLQEKIMILENERTNVDEHV